MQHNCFKYIQWLYNEFSHLYSLSCLSGYSGVAIIARMWWLQTNVMQDPPRSMILQVYKKKKCWASPANIPRIDFHDIIQRASVCCYEEGCLCVRDEMVERGRGIAKLAV